jgi:hypothetical protein
MIGMAVFLVYGLVMAGPANRVSQLMVSPENAGENVKIALQIRMAKVINEIALTNEQLIEILAQVNNTKNQLTIVKENAEKDQEELLSQLVQRQPVAESNQVISTPPLSEMQTIIEAYLTKLKSILTYEQGEKLETLLAIGVQNRNMPIQRTEQFRENALDAMKKVMESPAVNRMPGNMKEKIESTVNAMQKRENTMEQMKEINQQRSPALSVFGLSFLSDWGVELLERYIAGK